MSRKQFNLSRTALIAFIDQLDEDTADKQPAYFNNTIRWHIGHVLVFTEKLLFRFPNKSENLPVEYDEMFGPGTKPGDWKTEAPTLAILKEQLLDQSNRVNEFDELFWKTNVTFKVPYGSIETFGDLLIMIGHHESEHIGKMKAMHQVVSTS